MDLQGVLVLLDDEVEEPVGESMSLTFEENAEEFGAHVAQCFIVDRREHGDDGMRRVDNPAYF